MTEQIQIHQGITTCYLLRLPIGYLLVDTGFKHLTGIFESQLAAVGISINDIRFVLLTHHHQDHAGLLEYLLIKNPVIRVIMHEVCALYIENGENRMTENTIFSTHRIKTLFMMYKRATMNIDTRCPYKARPNDIIISGADTNISDETGLNCIILHTPGHSDDLISIFIEDIGLFCGDAAVNMYGFTGNKNLPIILEDIEQLYKSWEKIISTGTRIIYPAHGKPFSVEVLKMNLNKHLGKKHVKVLR